MVLSYPDVYEVGISNLGLQILYTHINDQTQIDAERAYCPWPDMADLMRQAHVPLWTLESGREVRAASIWGFTLPHELTFTNVLEMLDLAGVPLHAAERGPDDPVVLGGGPAVAAPLPLAPFFDAFFIGEAEAHIPALADVAQESERSRRLEALARIPGVWMPAVSAGPVRRQVYTAFSRSTPVLRPVVPVLEAVHDRAVIEVMRGCTAGCRFCQAGMWYRPVRERPVEVVVEAAERLLRETGCDEVSLMSLSSCDYSGVAEAVHGIRRARPDVRVSLPSLRVDSAAVVLSQLGSDQRGSVTLAPEAATQSLRDVVNKRVEDKAIMEATEAVFRGGHTGLKLYFMLGLPQEEDEDVAQIATLAHRVAEHARQLIGGRARVSVSVSTFIPKAMTPFADVPYVGSGVVQRRQALLRDRWPRGVRLSLHDPRTSLLEAVLARGGRECADLVEAAWRSGARFDGWSEHFASSCWEAAAGSVGLDLEGAAQAPPASSPVEGLASRRFLREEAVRASLGQTTADCRRDDCTGCGVCDPEIVMDLAQSDAGEESAVVGRSDG